MNKDKSDWKKPVKWLLGQQLVAGMKWIAVYALYGEKLDARDWMRAEWVEDGSEQDFQKDWQQRSGDAFWFDYFADSGDGQQSTYNMAYLAMSDLWLDKENSQPTADAVSLDKKGYPLPRGEFLFVGGDTAYHISDFSTLAERFQKPFNWAYDDVFGNQEKPANKKPIFAIPGNHDYYDALDGFHRQFCKPVKFPEGHPQAYMSKYSAQLQLKGFKRCQEASYVALKLPYDWQLWGLDCQAGDLDTRQQAYFLSTCCTVEDQLNTPDKLIVATPEPTTSFGQWATETAKLTHTFNEKLWLEPSFLQQKNGSLDEAKCRLDISGDIHHYERYWGQKPGKKSSTPNYASVVAGGGGAFLHATHTDVGEVKAELCYPSREDSYHLMMRRLLNPKNIFDGGKIWLAGGIVALVTYFALSIPDSSWALYSGFTDNPLIPDAIRPCGIEHKCDKSLLARIQQVLSIDNFQTREYSFHFFDLIYIFGLLGLAGYCMVLIKKHQTNIVQADATQWKTYKLNFIKFFAAAALPLWVLVILSGYGTKPSYPMIASLLVVLFLVAAAMMLVLARQIADLLTRRKKFTELPESHGLELSTNEQDLPAWLLIVSALITACFGGWRYGENSAALALTDTITLIVVLLGFVGVVVLAWFGGAILLSGDAKKRFIGIGFWHAVMQFNVALLLAIFADWVGMLLIVSFIMFITVLTPKLPLFKVPEGQYSLSLQEQKAKQLFMLWIVLGIAALLMALIPYWDVPKEITWLRLFTAFILGSVLSCTWFGWYLAVSLGFNGHNNEAGGGSRTASYRHFIRFKLTEDQLTGYVIGVDNASIDFTQDRKVRLVDVFTVNAPSKN